MCRINCRELWKIKKPAPEFPKRAFSKGNWLLLMRAASRRLNALDAGGLALALAEVVQLGRAHAAGTHDLDRADHRRVHREDALHTNTETHAAHGERFAGKLAAAAHNHAFERLDAFLIALAFFQADVNLDGIARTEVREILAKLGLLRFVHDRIHDSIFQADPLRWGQRRRTNSHSTETRAF